MKHPTATLEGANLDYAVALALGLKAVIEKHAIANPHPERNMVCWLVVDGKIDYTEPPYAPHKCWSQGGYIIEREKMNMAPDVRKIDGIYRDVWLAAQFNGDGEMIGNTYLIAAMRCFVASKLGEEVEIP